MREEEVELLQETNKRQKKKKKKKKNWKNWKKWGKSFPRPPHTPHFFFLFKSLLIWLFTSLDVVQHRQGNVLGNVRVDGGNHAGWWCGKGCVALQVHQQFLVNLQDLL